MRKITFWVMNILNVMLALADGLLTYINTPDLSMEANPLVTEFGLGWPALFTANLIAIGITVITSYYSCFKYKTVYTNETGFAAYCSQIVFDRPDRFWTGIIPKHISPYIAAAGYAFLYSFAIGRAVIVAEWLSVTFDALWLEAYNKFSADYCFGRIDVIVAVIAATTAIFCWLYKEFKTQLKTIPTDGQEDGTR